jgi:hypothetical protein
MEVLWGDPLQQFLQGDSWGTKRCHEELPIQEGHVYEHALLQMGLGSKGFRDAEG